jgi:hypothetical protein
MPPGPQHSENNVRVRLWGRIKNSNHRITCITPPKKARQSSSACPREDFPLARVCSTPRANILPRSRV